MRDTLSYPGSTQALEATVALDVSAAGEPVERARLQTI
jgi:hypothetical protein